MPPTLAMLRSQKLKHFVKFQFLIKIFCTFTNYKGVVISINLKKKKVRIPNVDNVNVLGFQFS